MNKIIISVKVNRVKILLYLQGFVYFKYQGINASKVNTIIFDI
jgi:hypothetical protein